MSTPTGSLESTRDCNVIAADFEAVDDPAPTGQNVPISGTTAITINVWHHAAATFEGRTWACTSTETSRRHDAVVAPVLRLHPACRAGHDDPVDRPRPDVGRFQGVLDEARVWGRARTGPEILASKNAELTSGSGLVARWGLNEGSGTSVGDSIATAANGTVTGSGYSWVVPPPDRARPHPRSEQPLPGTRRRRHLVGAGLQRWQRHHGLRGDPLHRRQRPDHDHGRQRHLDLDYGPHQRHRLHLPGGRDQRGRHRRPVGRLQRRYAGRRRRGARSR